jgi:hypothetical protein
MVEIADFSEKWKLFASVTEYVKLAFVLMTSVNSGLVMV